MQFACKIFISTDEDQMHISFFSIVALTDDALLFIVQRAFSSISKGSFSDDHDLTSTSLACLDVQRAKALRYRTLLLVQVHCRWPLVTRHVLTWFVGLL